MARTTGAALAASLTIHGLVGLTAWQAAPATRSMALPDAPILVGLGPSGAGDQAGSTAPWPVDDPDSLRLATWGKATVRCRVDQRRLARDCRWLSESAEGWGDIAVRQLASAADYEIYYGPGRPGDVVTFETSVCVGACPVP